MTSAACKAIDDMVALRAGILREAGVLDDEMTHVRLMDPKELTDRLSELTAPERKRLVSEGRRQLGWSTL